MLIVGLFSEDVTLRSLLSSALGREFQILFESDEKRMADVLSQGRCDVMILDIHSSTCPLQERLDCAERLIALNVPAIIMAEDALRSSAFELVRNGAFGYCRRPPSIRDLKTMLDRAFQSMVLEKRLAAAQPSIEDPCYCDKLLGASQLMQRVYRDVRNVANLSASVLVTGESGTGKELIARAIHNLSYRSARPFVAVSCAAIPETLIEAELFGHEKGAFTGTVGAREGYFEQAADGTLFLDEIGDLSLFTQVKLLRVLQQMEFNRLGSSRLVPVRARVIFATHRDLNKLLVEEKFRRDLYYRITVMRIEAPPLRDHLEDIPQIASNFLHRYSVAFQKPIDGIDPQAVELLQSYSWPGNVREMENVIQRAIILSAGKTIRMEDLNLPIEDNEAAGFDNVLDIAQYQSSDTFEQQLNVYRIRLAMNAIRENNGNKTLAARSLRISRAYLHRLIRLSESEIAAEQQLSTAI